MSENQEKITPLKNTEDYEKLKADYEAEKKQLKDKAEEWKNVAVKRDQEILVKDKMIDRLTEERDDWKTEANARAKVQQETKQYKETTDFLTSFKELQAKKGLHWDEARGWITINNK